MSEMTVIVNMVKRVKEASRMLGSLSAKSKNRVLNAMAGQILKSKTLIKKANALDLENATKQKLKGAFMDRLTLTDKRITGMADSVREIARLDDPVGLIEELDDRPNGLLIGKVRVPIGVMCVIYESRPNVTSDCIALAFKSGNGLILRGGRESIHSNVAIFDAMKKAATKAGAPENAFGLVRTIDRKAVSILLGLEGLIDVIIPRGGESLIREVVKKSRIPVIKHYKGVCHIYVDEYADLNMAESIAYNAKVQRPGVCNAMETLLVHKDVAARFLPGMAARFGEAGVEMRGCDAARRVLRQNHIKKAKVSDWSAEYLDLILSIRVVNSYSEALDHIERYGTRHSDAIITENTARAMDFAQKVDSSSVYINASTRFTDGYEFGKGAEIGISTDKLHARGPVGLEELTTHKYVIFGNGQVRK